MGLFGLLFGKRKIETAIDYANRFNGFAPYLSMPELELVLGFGQAIAREMDPDSFNKPRSGYYYKFPMSAVGEFNALFGILESRNNVKQFRELQNAAKAFRDEYKGIIPSIHIYLQIK